MSERFTKLYELQKNLYSEGSPIIVSAGSLLKDNQTSNIIVQLKFHSVSTTTIKALKVGIAAFDIAGKEIDGIPEYQYLDLSIQNGQEFGSNKAIVMPDPVTRSFTINSITVVQTDGHIQNVSMPLSSLPQPVAIQSVLKDVELVKQYKIKTNDNTTYAPQESYDLWQCHCGEWNSHSVCNRCNARKSTAFAALDLPMLTNEMNARLAEEAQKKAEAERQAEIERQEKEKQLAILESHRKAAAKRAKKILMVVMPVLVLVVVFTVWVYPDIIKPSMMYKAASELLANGQHDAATAAFEELGDYKDAEIMAQEALFQKGCSLLNNQKYDEAISVFSSLGDYSDSAEKEAEAYYQKAVFLSECGEIEDAITIFKKLSEYQDSDTKCLELQYSLATDYLNNDNYDEAKSIFLSISPHENSADMAKECDYRKGCAYYENSQYLDAVAAFESIAGYLDADEKVTSAYSLYYLEQGTILYNEAKFYLSIETLQKSSETDATAIIAKAENEIEYINNICGEYRLVEEYWYNDKVTIGPANRDYCIVSFDFEKGCFVFDNSKYVAEHSFEYNFDRNAKLHYTNYYQGGKDYDYQFVNGRLLWDEGNGTYEYYEKR